MKKIQEEFRNASGNVIKLTPGEYEGPLVIDRPCVIDGGGSTILSMDGPVVYIKSINVTLRNMRIELADNAEEAKTPIAIRSVDSNAKLENIEVRGRVVGIANESEAWDLEPVIDIGSFAADTVNTILLTIDSPSGAKLSMRVNGLTIFPSALTPGRNFLLLTTDQLRHGSRLYGELMVETKVLRRIYVTGVALNTAQKRTASLPTQSAPSPAPSAVPAPRPASSNPVPPAPQGAESSVRVLPRGQRMFASELKSSELRFVLDYAKVSPDIDLDCYCFALGENGRVLSNSGMIFFRNQESADHSVRIDKVRMRPMVTVDLSKVVSTVTRIAVCFAIYGTNPTQNFTKISAPSIRIYGGEKECFRFDLSHLQMEKCVVAVEVYRYKGDWKINLVGSGYRESLSQLCRDYGVNVT